MNSPHTHRQARFGLRRGGRLCFCPLPIGASFRQNLLRGVSSIPTRDVSADGATICCRCGDHQCCLDCVKALVEAGADVNAVWVQGDPNHLPGIITAYHLAKHDDHADIAVYLLAHGVVILKPEPISTRSSKGDPAKGAAFFASTCAVCHAVRANEISTNNGPTLWNVVGRDKASAKFEGYSKTLLAWDGTWTYEDLNVFLAGPTLTTPGVNMELRGVSEEADRLSVIAYLRTLADTPMPLP
ncbi:c-type cytochrome [Mesorhizobium sp. M4B.F.Ca.ET.143.01.1.1]|nr:c-type cytochrome [Mesorhizobium sp. M4B.F.Ca.ET.049.02.1.2]TGV23211.1 c-type cytochrome [Mesorhizobium sp. M4B.F.Ca.ET.143.01.1.1]